MGRHIHFRYSVLESLLYFGRPRREEMAAREKVEQIIADGHINLVETLCEKIAAACLKDKRVMAARVRVEKPNIIKNARSVGVEIERQR